MFVKILVCGLLITFCGTLNLFAQDGCGVGGYIRAYVVYKDPKGLNVRDQPSLKGKVLATVKPTQDQASNPTLVDPDEPWFIQVQITEFSNGWVKIKSANGEEGSSFEGIGWVSAKMAVRTNGYATKDPSIPPTGLETVDLYAASNSKRKIGTMPHNKEVLITGFTCDWVKVKYKTKIGWARQKHICGAALAPWCMKVWSR